MIEIRQTKQEDLKDIQLINQLNSSNPNKPIDEKTFCLYLYSGYYVLLEEENCFIAADTENNETAGYILGASDCSRYMKQIEEDFFEEAVKLGFRERFLAEIHAYEPYKDEYPAHFHIDVRPGYQHMGVGTMLLDAQIANMKKQGIQGLMLLVGKNKISGNRFYEKNGFSVIDENEDTYARGKKI